MAERDPNELGALWEKTTSSGKTYMSGTIGGQRVVVFRAKKSSEKSPDWRVLKSVPKDAADQRTPLDDNF